MKSKRIAFVADGRSPIALNWINYFIEHDYDVHLISTQPCDAIIKLKSLHILSLLVDDFIPQYDQKRRVEIKREAEFQKTIKSLTSPALRSIIKHYLYPMQVMRKAHQLSKILQDIKPDLVHAMRIPYEGMLAALAIQQDKTPLLISVWGNDFTLHGNATPLMRKLTIETLKRADALHTDCQRDNMIAYQWGFDMQKPSVVLPGGGGIKTDVFFPNDDKRNAQWKTVINPRGFRAYVCNETFFKAVPLIKTELPQVRFICTAMQGIKRAESWLEAFQATEYVELLPVLPPVEMAHQFQRAEITVSLSTHDGTPNTLLEALACGCFPIVGDLDSLREWIIHGENGFLVNPLDEHEVAQTVIKAFGNDELLRHAKEKNLQLIREKAEYYTIMKKVIDFYEEVMSSF